MKNILITGCNGYIGSCISAYLKKNFFIIGIDKKKKSQNKHINVKYNLNLNNFKILKSKLNKHKIDLIIHLAGESTLDNIKNQNDYYVNNVLATKNLIKISNQLKINNIIFSSTAAVYAGGLKLLSEKSKIKPQNVYGKTKLICEELIKKEFEKKNKSYVIFRFFNVCSSYLEKKVGEMHNPETHLIPILVNKSINSKNFKIYGANYKTSDGTCIRDYIHIKDLCIAHEKVINQIKRKSIKQVFNLGTSRGFSVLQLAKKVQKFSKNKFNIFFVDKRKGDLPKLVCTAKKAKKVLKWKPNFSNVSRIIQDEFKWQKYLSNKKIKIKTIY